MADDARTHGETDESESERLTRNLNELLQELRVTQTGVQILTGFLLTLPFSNRFNDLDSVQRPRSSRCSAGSVVATGLIIGAGRVPPGAVPARRAPLAGDRREPCCPGRLFFLALTTSGMVWLVFDLVTDRTVATVAGVLSAVFFTTLWVVVPAAGAAVRAADG